MSNRLSPTATVRERLENWSMPEPNSGCLLWLGTIGSHGYGTFTFRGRGGLTAHRASWEERNGPVPDGLHILHKCDVKACINPDHLYAGTREQNMQDMSARVQRAFPPRHGEENNSAKLTDEDVLAIRADDRSGVLIAEAYSVSRSLISAIKLRRAWRHLP